MRPSLQRRDAVLLCVCVCLALCGLPGCRNPGAEPPGPVALQFSLSLDPQVYAQSHYKKPPQFAVWIEDAAGEEIRTVWVTEKTGAVMALPIWARTMTQYFEDTPEPHFIRPPGLLEKLVCRDTGQLATVACVEVGEEIFVDSMVPTRTCELHQPGAGRDLRDAGDFEDIDKNSGSTDEFEGANGGYR